MILESVFGVSLVVSVAFSSQTPTASPAALTELSVRQKDAALLPLVQRATACIVRQVTTDPRYRDDLRPTDVQDLIVDSIAACGRPVRVMIQAHDRMYGYGSGESFLLGPYLDVLPAAVTRRVNATTRR